MLAFGLSLALFVGWVVLGYSVMASLRRRSNVLQNMLLAPVMGLTVTLLPIFWISRLGLPVKQFGVILLFVLLILTAFLLWRFRPPVAVRQYMAFAFILLLGLIIVARPMFEFGFNWLSYSNDDMANYVMRATRFLNNSYLGFPDAAQLQTGRDYTQIWWFFDVPGGNRAGADLILAWVMSVTGLTGHQIFMPVIVAFHLALISSIGGLVVQAKRFRFAALLSCALLAVSPLTTLGTMYQLIAQVLGLTLLCGCAVALLQPPATKRSHTLIRYAIVLALLISAQFISYPEVVPILALAFILHWVVKLIRQRQTVNWRPAFSMIAIAGVLSLLFLNTYVPYAIEYILKQTTGAIPADPTKVYFFPYYLIPKGLADLWGLQALTNSSREPILSITIAMGGALLVLAVIAAARQAWKGSPAAGLALVMVALGFFLFWRRTDFGLFKLAMYIQPFIIASLVMASMALKKRWIRNTLLVALLALGLMQIPQQQYYIEASRGFSVAFVEIPRASSSAINGEFQRLSAATASPSTNLVIDTSNVVLAKFMAVYTKGIPTAFISNALFFQRFASKTGLNSPGNEQKLVDAIQAQYVRQTFALHDPNNPEAVNAFTEVQLGRMTGANQVDTLVILTCPRINVLNRRRLTAECGDSGFLAVPLDKVHNTLVFINSELGQHYYAASRQDNVSFYQLEQDYFNKGQTMIGVGQNLLFETLQSTPQVRLVVEMTESLQNDGENKLPPLAAIGTQRQLFHVVGRGSMRLFSPPLLTQKIGARDYVGIDIGTSAQYFPDYRTGLNTLYGTDIRGDRRQLTGFVRDIALVSDSEYTSMQAPSSLSAFPNDLANRALEYSGMYEDGWVSEEVMFGLRQPSNATDLVVRGIVPDLGDSNFSTDLTVLIDGQQVAQRTLKLGPYETHVTVPESTERRQIQLRFSKFQHLGTGDKRPVTSLLSFIGFEAVH